MWYLERLHLPQNRVNPSGSFEKVSFGEITLPCNRQYLKDYMKYQFGFQASPSARYGLNIMKVHTMLMWFSECGEDVSKCTSEMADKYIRTLEERGVTAKTFNEYLAALHHFFSFLVVKEHMKHVPFRIEYYQKKVIPKHLNRSVSPDVCMEILEKLPPPAGASPCMYFT